MANSFRSFLEKIGLVAPQKATEPAMPQPKAETPVVMPQTVETAAPAAKEEPVMPEVGSESPSECNSEHMDCTNDPKGCCKRNAEHQGMAHECESCKQSF
jgi:hypothetical protein